MKKTLKILSNTFPGHDITYNGDLNLLYIDDEIFSTKPNNIEESLTTDVLGSSEDLAKDLISFAEKFIQKLYT